uniref:Uncharacterized protein n=1 Tax=Cannabis sativa TaxID=3483 RepID=A0A803P5M6_CANSA
MDPLMNKMKTKINLTEDEESVFQFHDTESTSPLLSVDTVLYAKILTKKKVWLSTLQNQMAEHWDGRFPVKISEAMDMFMLTFGCEGDKIRVLDREPYHFQNHHIVLYTPEVGKNFTSDDLTFTPFWVQIYRLPFLSKTRTLAIALGNIIGEYKDVFEDSLNEGWGPFLRVRVLLDVSKPLKRGRMISLSHVKDKFWVDFRYERLPEYCMECGVIGHPYNKCSVFLEKLDNGEEPALEYQPFIKGSTLPTSGYDRYRTDFAKGDAWPLITRLAKKSLTSAIPQLAKRGQPHPRILFSGESSNTNNFEDSNNNLDDIVAARSMVPKDTIKPPSVVFHPSTLLSSAQNLHKGMNAPATKDSPTNFSDLSSIYMPAFVPNTTNTFATYPPQTSLTDIRGKQPMPAHATNALPPKVAPATISPAVMHWGTENTNPNVQSKRQNEGLSLRQTLKRCRGTIPNDAASTLSVGEVDHHLVSIDLMDSMGDKDNSVRGLSDPPHSSMKIPFHGDKFTWIKGRHNPNALKERLDWCFLNDLWETIFKPITTAHLDYYSSDHRAIAVTIEYITSNQQQPTRKTRFRFEKIWLKEPDAASIIRAHWSDTDAGGMDIFLSNLQSCTDALQQWHIRKFGNMKKKITNMQQQVSRLNNPADRSVSTMDELKDSEAILDELLEQEETYWHQRSRVDWLQCGDQNTSFFHAHATSRKSKNVIKSLINTQGLSVSSKAEMTNVICDYYTSLFASDGVDPDSLNDILTTVPASITHEMNQSLTTPFTSNEVLNNDKSVMSFSPNTSLAAQDFFARTLHMPITECHERYLGLPSYSGRDKQELFSSIKDKVWKLLHAWNEKIFSVGGKEVLLKAVVQSIPTYAMSCFKLTKKFCDQLERDGIHVDSGKDPWIPSHNDFKPVSYLGSASLPVSHFITNNRVWNVPLLTSYFQQIDIDRILSIPLAYFAGTDRLVWHHSPNGIYSVKTGFHLATTLEDQNSSSTSNKQSEWWKFFWNLKLPPKIRIFAWKVFQNILPTAVALFKRKVLDSGECSLCTSNWESIGHALFSCKHAKDIWKLSRFRIDFSQAHNMFNGDYLYHLSTIYQQHDFETLLCVLWGIWTDRNKVVHGGQPRHPTAIVQYASKFYEDFNKAKLQNRPVAATSSHHSSPSTSATDQHVQRWRPPVRNGYKLNVDAATNIEQKKLGIGAILRDQQGTVLAALSKAVQGSFKSDEMEAKALFHAVNWVSQSQFPLTHIETDASRVSNALNRLNSDLSCFSDLIMDIRCLLSSFPQVLVTHVKRTANQAAHGLAKYALGLDEDFVWIGEIPYPVFSDVVNDSNL